ncbi:MAG: hypothetical protein LBJ64_00845 [Deltaproteobacteria bacterium]|jgi:hypothetical protein|nr:hypothetical protein [Deltaproteobacteria bacterium]
MSAGWSLEGRGDEIVLPDGPLAAVFLDLDDSVFQTRRKCPPGPLETATLDSQGRPSSYFGFGQRCLLELFSWRTLIVPTTARDRAAFGRVKFDFRHGAILNHGGLILRPDGEIEPVWQERMRPLCAEAGPLLAAVLDSAERVMRHNNLNCRARIIGDAGLDFYVVVKSNESRVEDLRTILNEIKGSELGRQIRIDLNDNNLAFRPLFLDKAEAAAYFAENLLPPNCRDLPTIGLGDGFSDLEFMRRCDFLLTPRGSQISSLLSAPEAIGSCSSEAPGFGGSSAGSAAFGTASSEAEGET